MTDEENRRKQILPRRVVSLRRNTKKGKHSKGTMRTREVNDPRLRMESSAMLE